MNTGEAPIRVEALNHSFRQASLGRQVLFDISTTIPAGEIVILTGPSGSGKTTFLTIVSALRSVQEGSVRVLGQELNGARSGALERVRRNIGFIFQQHNLLDALSAVENVELGLRVGGRFRGAALRRRAEEYLEMVGLAERMYHHPQQLSGGQRQRVAIARALASEPPLLMADEPTASLDRKSGREVVERMKFLAKEHGTTILMVTHDNRVLDVADRIVYLEDGRLSTFTDAVIDNSQQMMRIIADTRGTDEGQGSSTHFDFQYMMVEISLQAQRVLALRGRVNPFAYRSILMEALQGGCRRVSEHFDGAQLLMFRHYADERECEALPLEGTPATLQGRVEVDRWPSVRQTLESGEPLLLANDTGIEGIDAELDGALGYATVSLISVPIRARSGTLAVVQLRQRDGDKQLNDIALRDFARFAESIRYLVEAIIAG